MHKNITFTILLNIFEIKYISFFNNKLITIQQNTNV